jgi:hypothetical protein
VVSVEVEAAARRERYHDNQVRHQNRRCETVVRNFAADDLVVEVAGHELEAQSWPYSVTCFVAWCYFVARVRSLVLNVYCRTLL